MANIKMRLPATFALLVILPAFLPAQERPLTRYEFAHPQMGTKFRFVFYTSDSTRARRAAEACFQKTDELNFAMSDYLPESELMRLCDRAGSGKKVSLSPDLWRILRQADHFSRQSGGAFDATIGPLTHLWRRARHLQELPDSQHIAEARQLVGFEKISFYRKKRRVALLRAGMKLDLGGIAQGYAADACLKILKKRGISRALVDAGGDIALGDPPPGEPGWRIETPSDSMYLAHCGITTSGGNTRYLQTSHGRRYSHIVDPRTGWGLTHRVLVTVQAPTATEADAWATAISVLGRAGWEALRHRHPELQVWLTEERW